MINIGGGGVQLLGGGSYRSPKEIKYLFIDGGCLRQMVLDSTEKHSDFDIYKIDFTKLVLGFSKIFYYDSLPPRHKKEKDDSYYGRVDDQEAFFNDLRTIPGIHVYEGDARKRRRTVEQKKVDIMIAVDMLTHSFRRNMHHATLMTADLDFKPLIDALVQDGMHVELWYPKGKPNEELIYAADMRRPLTYKDLHSWCIEQYRKQYPLPVAFSAPNKQEHIKSRELIDNWEAENGTILEVFKSEIEEKKYMAVFPSKDNQDKKYYTYILHGDLELLKIFVLEYFPHLWKTPI